MSTIRTRSKFYFGHLVLTSNNKIDFNEGSGELTAELPVGDYTLEEYAQAVEDVLNDVGSLTYTVVVDRVSRKLTVSATGNFSFLITSGTNNGESAFEMMGFNGADISGDDEYEGDSASGEEYEMQYPFFSYISFDDWKLQESAVVNLSASGVVQAVGFGDGQRMQGNMRIITDRMDLNTQCMDGFRESATGVLEAKTFLTYAITKGKMEFMSDAEDPENFIKVILESTPYSKEGTGFQLKNMGVPDFYETGVLQFRKVVG